jgi:hypothetical protein
MKLRNMLQIVSYHCDRDVLVCDAQSSLFLIAAYLRGLLRAGRSAAPHSDDRERLGRGARRRNGTINRPKGAVWCQLDRFGGRRGDEIALVTHANHRDVWMNVADLFPHPYREADADAWITRVEADKSG